MTDKKSLWTLIAKQYGLELNEVFKLSKGEVKNTFFRFTEEGMKYFCVAQDNWIPAVEEREVLHGEVHIEKLPWKPRYSETYWFVTWHEPGGSPYTVETTWNGTECNLVRYAIGNCFRTEEDAEAHKWELAEKMRAKEEVERLTTEQKENIIKNKLSRDGFHRGDIVQCQDGDNRVEIGIDRKTGDLMVSPKEHAFPQRIDTFYEAAIIHYGVVLRRIDL